MRKFVALVALLIASTSWGQTITVPTAIAPGTYTLMPAGSGITPPPPPPVSAGTYTVYANGIQGGGDGNWVGDFDNSTTEANYKDTTGKPTTGAYDLKFTGNQKWPIWMPYANNPPKSFPMASYTTVQFDLKPTSNAEPFSFYFVPAGDETSPSSCTVNLPNSSYSATFVAGVWVHVTIPLSVLCVTNPSIYPGANVFKFGLQEQSGSASPSFYINNVTFQ